MKTKKNNELGSFGAYDDLLGAPREAVAGPLIGGGATQAAIMATRLLFKGKPNVTKWAGLIGAGVGAAVSGALMFSPRHRATGTAGLIVAALIGIPRQIEDMLEGAGMLKDSYLGVVTAEQAAMAGYGYDDGSAMMGVPGVQLLDSGLGVTVAEQANMGAISDDVQMLGSSGFGANFLG